MRSAEASALVDGLSDRQLVAFGRALREQDGRSGFGRDQARMSKAEKVEHVTRLLYPVDEATARALLARILGDPQGDERPKGGGDSKGDERQDRQGARDDDARAKNEESGKSEDDPAEVSAEAKASAKAEVEAIARALTEGEVPATLPPPQEQEVHEAAQQAGPLLEALIRTLASDVAAHRDDALALGLGAFVTQRLSRLGDGAGYEAAPRALPPPPHVPPAGPGDGATLEHAALRRVLSLVRLPAAWSDGSPLRPNVMLVGPAGGGKTMLARQVAQHLDRPFGCVSLSGGVTESALLGRLLPVGEGGRWGYVPAPFVDAYAGGGVYLCDEVDAADPNVLLVINAALANGHLTVEHRAAVGQAPDVVRHDDAVILCAANTDGTGATMLYTGRSRLDAAFLDRFVLLEVGYDPRIEASIMGTAATGTRAKVAAAAWSPIERDEATLRGELRAAHAYILKARERARAGDLTRVISTRAHLKARALLLAGWSRAEVTEALLFGWSDDERATCAKATAAYTEADSAGTIPAQGA